jgi:hypothetical protein
MVRIVPSEAPRPVDPKAGATQKVYQKPEEHSESDMLQKDSAKASKLAEVIQMFRRKERQPRSRNQAIKRYLESQDQFEVGDPLGFRIDRKV